MTWGNFILSLAVIYLLYYAVNILLDSMKKSRGSGKDNMETLVFEETIVPKNVEEPTIESSLPKEVELKPKEVELPLEKKELSNQIKERKEESINENLDSKIYEKQTSVVDKAEKESLSGGLQFGDLLKLVRQESVIKTSQIDFG